MARWWNTPVGILRNLLKFDWRKSIHSAESKVNSCLLPTISRNVFGKTTGNDFTAMLHADLCLQWIRNRLFVFFFRPQFQLRIPIRYRSFASNNGSIVIEGNDIKVFGCCCYYCFHILDRQLTVLNPLLPIVAWMQRIAEILILI